MVVEGVEGGSRSSGKSSSNSSCSSNSSSSICTRDLVVCVVGDVGVV